MNIFLTIYLSSVISSFCLLIYDETKKIDVTLLDLLVLTFLSFIPGFNTWVALTILGNTLKDYYINGGFDFLDKVIIKRKA